VQLRLEVGDADIVLSVEDDGEQTGGRLAPKAGAKSGLGLLGMQERVVSLGGTLWFERRPTGGALLVATIPSAGAEP
jgi:signal transduction histidine kinase